MNRKFVLSRLAFFLTTSSLLTFVAVIHNAVPGFTLPTLGQALWVTGFATSYANQDFPGIFAHDIGLPGRAAISFGLSGAWPTAVLIKLGLPLKQHIQQWSLAGLALRFLAAIACACY